MWSYRNPRRCAVEPVELKGFVWFQHSSICLGTVQNHRPWHKRRFQSWLPRSTVRKEILYFIQEPSIRIYSRGTQSAPRESQSRKDPKSQKWSRPTTTWRKLFKTFGFQQYVYQNSKMTLMIQYSKWYIVWHFSHFTVIWITENLPQHRPQQSTLGSKRGSGPFQEKDWTTTTSPKSLLLWPNCYSRNCSQPQERAQVPCTIMETRITRERREYNSSLAS